MLKVKQAVKFKKITATDLQLIESFTQNFDGYSDFATSNLLCWNKDNSNEYALIDQTLIIKTIDNLGEKQVITALSKEDTTRIFLDLEKLGEDFSYIPEVTLNNIHSNTRISAFDDRNSYDYIYKTAEIDNITGTKYAKKRGKINQFSKNYPDFSIKEIDIYQKNTIQDINLIMGKWANQKNLKAELFECTFLENKLKTKGAYQDVSLGMYVGKELIGFSSTQIQKNNTALINLLKTDLTYSNSGTFMFYQTNKYLKNNFHIELLNFDCDLGLDGLRINKETWNPAKYLKKYQLTINH
ncbi:MAG: DUF2156 domain-containing protein [Niabella sp.]|nr:MAG: DUF2156 domain-containing protein [Niabella sp.]